jgi:AraC family L-rhamnose operon transcriptional activator RhaR/AraC family L-rhamnose operon regulatory protein RhaS
MEELLRAETYHLDSAHPVAVFELADGSRNYHTHGHEFCEIAVVAAGTGFHVLDGLETPLAAGDSFVIPPGSRHAFRSLEGFHVLNVLFIEDALLARLPELACLPGYRGLLHWEPRSRPDRAAAEAVRLEPARLGGHLAQLRRIGGPGEGRGLAEALGAVCALGLFLIDLCGAFEAAPGGSARRYVALERAIAWVEGHIGEGFGLPELARAAALSPSSLARRFREAMDCSPMEYVQRERLRRARLLLEDPALTIAASAATGFADASHLSRAFKAAFGLSPRDYRRGARQN